MKYVLSILLCCLMTPAYAQTLAEDLKAGQRLLDDDRPAEAVKRYDHALSLDPDSVEALYGRGVASTQCFNAAGAIRDLTTVLQEKPHDPYARYWRATAYGQQNKHAEAISDFTAVLSNDEARSGDLRYLAYVYRGLNRNALGELTAARADMDAAVALDPGRSEGFAGRARVRQAQGDTAGAESDSQRAGAIDPDLGTSLGAHGAFQLGQLIYIVVAGLVGLFILVGAVPLFRSIAMLAKADKAQAAQPDKSPVSDAKNEPGA